MTNDYQLPPNISLPHPCDKKIIGRRDESCSQGAAHKVVITAQWVHRAPMLGHSSWLQLGAGAQGFFVFLLFSQVQPTLSLNPLTPQF